MAVMLIPIHQAAIELTQVFEFYVLCCQMPIMKKYRKVTKGNGWTIAKPPTEQRWKHEKQWQGCPNPYINPNLKPHRFYNFIYFCATWKSWESIKQWQKKTWVDPSQATHWANVKTWKQMAWVTKSIHGAHIETSYMFEMCHKLLENWLALHTSLTNTHKKKQWFNLTD